MEDVSRRFGITPEEAMRVMKIVEGASLATQISVEEFQTSTGWEPAAMPEVVIRNPKTGEEYGIDSADFRRGHHYLKPDGSRVTYADAGFRIVSLADGQPYTGPLNEPPAERGA